MPEIFLIAGEASGDLHASNLVREIRTHCGISEFKGIGGDNMRREGVKTIIDMNEVNFIGFTSVMKNISKIRTYMKQTLDEIRKSDPAAVILVDFPGFNLRIAEKLREFYKGKIIYYIAPQVWAWHKSRVKLMKKVVDELIVVFPFEVGFFGNEGIKAEYPGHPLVKRIDDFLRNESASAKKGKTISFMPGSRKGEIESMLPVMIKTGELLKDKYQCRLQILCAPQVEEEFYKKFPGTADFDLVHDRNNTNANYSAILNSDLVITKSGTSTLECALIGTPFLVVYKTSPVNYLIGKALVDVKYISIVNILLEKPAVKEFLQNEMTPENLCAEAGMILENEEYRNNMKNEFGKLRQILGNSDASKKAAEVICSLLNQ